MSAQPWLAKKRWTVLLLCIFFVPVVGFYGFKAWKRYSIQISTDKAYVQADMAQITPRLQGTVAEAIEANYKETQLTHVRVGQPAGIRADIYPDHVYRGKVESLSGGTGAAFSLLPPENATGNWVKVVQRLPVKIVLTEPLPANLPLRVGLSVEVSIDTSDRQGPLLSSLHQGAPQAPTTISPTTHLEPDQSSLFDPSGHYGK